MVYSAKSDDSNTISQFTRREEIEFTTTGTSIPEDYQVKVTIAYEPEMQSAFQDIRFNTKAGVYIDYWIESKIDSNTADVWLELPNTIIDPGIDTIIMFYGNNILSDGSNIGDTFVFGDDFDYIDTSLWDNGIDTVFLGVYDGETSIVVEGDTAHCWTGGAADHQSLEYSYANDSKCAVYTQYPGNPIMTNIRFPTVIKNGSTYYLFVHNTSIDGLTGNIYLWSSTDKINWNIMNSGNPVLELIPGTLDAIANVDVSVVDDVWHMIIEGGKTGDPTWSGWYSYSNLTDMNWTTHITKFMTSMSSPHLEYVPDRNSFLLFAPTGDITLHMNAYYANISDDLSVIASWHKSGNFDIGNDRADPTFAVVGLLKDYNIIFQSYKQTGPTYQRYSSLSLNEFFDAITLNSWFFAPSGLGGDSFSYLITNKLQLVGSKSNSHQQVTLFKIDAPALTDYIQEVEMTADWNLNYRKSGLYVGAGDAISTDVKIVGEVMHESSESPDISVWQEYRNPFNNRVVATRVKFTEPSYPDTILMRMIKVGTSYTAEAVVDGITHTGSGQVYTGDTSKIGFTANNDDSTNTFTCIFDNYRVRKYIIDEPTVLYGIVQHQRRTSQFM